MKEDLLQQLINLLRIIMAAGCGSIIGYDSSRVAAGVVTVIGILGAGVIFVRNQTVSGLTTSAGVLSDRGRRYGVWCRNISDWHCLHSPDAVDSGNRPWYRAYRKFGISGFEALSENYHG